jgi:hypothetical protein
MSGQYGAVIDLAASRAVLVAKDATKTDSPAEFQQNLRFAMIGLLEGIFEAVKEKYDPNADLRGVMDELDLFVKVGEPTGKVD